MNFPLCVILGLSLYAAATSVLFYGAYRLTFRKGDEIDIAITVYQHQQGSITYQVFQNKYGLQVRNYTQDSLEYEFLQQSTKSSTYESDTSIHRDTSVKVQ